jgi:ribosome-binding factor A
VLGDEEQREQAFAGLISARGFLQSRVAHELRMKHTPRLQLVYDETAERGARISQLLREIGEER